MATLERGKGKRKQVIEIVRYGSVLCMRETDAGDNRLTGYRRCADEAAAQSGLTAEVSTLIEAGMTPADDEARAIAAARPPKASGPPALPVRADLAIYNEATGFVVTSRKMAGKTLDEGSAEWKKAVTKGQMLPVTLMQDDPFIIRVVAGGPLTPEEEAEWVSRIDWFLNVPDGKLCVTGGAEFASEGYDADDPGHERYVGELLIPKGTYRASLHGCAHGVNGELSPEESDGDIVDFLLHLEPVASPPKSGLSALPDEGWFDGHENARPPASGSAGLAARNVIRRLDEPTGQWTFVRDVFGLMPTMTRHVVKGDAVTVPLDSLGRAAGIAWLGSRFIVLEFRLTPPAGAALDLSGEWPDGLMAVQEAGAGRLLFDADLDFDGIRTALGAAGPALAAQPEGAMLEMCSVAIETLPGTPEHAGLVSFRGPVTAGGWRILQSYPEVDSATLSAALALAGELNAGKLSNTAAINGFARRFSSTFPAKELGGPAHAPADTDDDDGLFPTAPVKGAEVFTAPGGRVYHATMAMLVSQRIGEEIPKRERPLLSAGFKGVGGVVCSTMQRVGFHGYIRPGGQAWAYFRLAHPFEIEFEIATLFSDGTVVVTTAGPSDQLKDVIDSHERRVAEQAALRGAPRPVEFNLRSLAETVEAVLQQP